MSLGTCDVLQLLLRRSDKVQITKKVILTAASNCSVKAMELLLSRDDIEMTESILKAAIKFPHVPELLLSCDGKFNITEDVSLSAASARCSMTMRRARSQTHCGCC